MQVQGTYNKLLKLGVITVILLLLIQTIVAANDLSPNNNIAEVSSETPVHIEGIAQVKAGNTLVNQLMKDIEAEIEAMNQNLKEIDSNTLSLEENLNSAKTNAGSIVAEAEAAAAKASTEELDKYATAKEVDIAVTYYVGKVPYQKDIYDHGFELYLGEVNTKDAEAMPL